MERGKRGKMKEGNFKEKAVAFETAWKDSHPEGILQMIRAEL